jgi:peptide/nickel transport system ATP-binding protein
MEEVLRIEHLWVEGRLPGGDYAPIVKDVDVSVRQGEVVALIGESGSGKTTISLAALGYARPGCRISKGRIMMGDKNILELSNKEKRELRGRSIAYLAQSAAAAFNPAMTIGYQVTEAPVLHGLMKRQEASARAIEIYRRLELPHPESLGRLYPHQVSGGQLQRLMVAMALSCNPNLMVLDEPTTALDVTTQIEVLTAIKEIIRQHNTAAIYVTHDLAVVAQIADRILVLFDGEVQERGSTAQIVGHPSHPYTLKLMRAVRPAPKTTLSVSDSQKPEELTAGQPLLQVKDLTAGYGRIKKKVVLRDVCIDVPPGIVVGVIGESGCGKSTLARAIAGLLPPISGEMLLAGHALRSEIKMRSKKELQRIQIVFQMPDVALNPRQRIRDILGRPLEFYMGLSSSGRKQRVHELLEMVELPRNLLPRYPDDLSGGEKQRVNLARALAAEPDLILCDEVTSSLDTLVGAAVIDLLNNLQKQLNLAYMFISHDLSTVASFADSIVVLYAGRVAEQGTLQSVLAPPHHPYTRLLLSSVPELHPGWLEDVITSREAMTAISRAVEITDVGCPFFKRCAMAITGVCDLQNPPLRTPAAGHQIFCHREIANLQKTVFEN